MVGGKCPGAGGDLSKKPKNLICVFFFFTFFFLVQLGKYSGGELSGWGICSDGEMPWWRIVPNDLRTPSNGLPIIPTPETCFIVCFFFVFYRTFFFPFLMFFL